MVVTMAVLKIPKARILSYKIDEIGALGGAAISLNHFVLRIWLASILPPNTAIKGQACAS